MSLIIAIGNYIGINQLGITPPYGGEDIVTETGVQPDRDWETLVPVKTFFT